MGLVLDWQKKLGYRHDPFDTNIPSPTKKYLVGLAQTQERLNLFLIKEEKFGTIAAEKGCGKTMLLRWMDEELAPQKTHAQHYIDAKHAKKEDMINTLLLARLSLLEKTIRSPLKLPLQEREKTLLTRLAKENRNVLLVDNAGSLGKQELDFFAELIDKTPTHVIFSDTKERLKKAEHEGMKDTLKLSLQKYSDNDMTEILKRRIESAGVQGTHPFDDDELKSLVKESADPRDLLQRAKERAMELSLKVRDAPKAVPHEKGFFNIKVEKNNTQTPKDNKKEIMQHDAPSQNNILDAQALAQIVGESSEDRPKKREVREITNEKNIVETFDTITMDEKPKQKKKMITIKKVKKK